MNQDDRLCDCNLGIHTTLQFNYSFKSQLFQRSCVTFNRHHQIMHRKYVSGEIKQIRLRNMDMVKNALLNCVWYKAPVRGSGGTS